MPDDKLNEEVNEFDEVFNEIVDKTDEELAEEAVKEAQKKADEASGDANKDQQTDVDPDPAANADPNPADGDQKPDPDTTPKDTSFYEDRITELEAQLSKETQRTASWDGRIKAANKKVKDLEAENKQLRDKLLEDSSPGSSSDDQSDEEVMATFRKTFPELVEVIDIMQKKIDAKATSPTPTPAKETSYDADQDLMTDEEEYKKEEARLHKEHIGRIKATHKDLDEMIKSGALMQWINEQPDFIRPHLTNIYQSGSSEQIIKMLSEFKTKSGWKSQSQRQANSKQDKLNSMREAEGDSQGPTDNAPDPNDFAGAAKEAGL